MEEASQKKNRDKLDEESKLLIVFYGKNKNLKQTRAPLAQVEVLGDFVTVYFLNSQLTHERIISFNWNNKFTSFREVIIALRKTYEGIPGRSIYDKQCKFEINLVVNGSLVERQFRTFRVPTFLDAHGNDGRVIQ